MATDLTRMLQQVSKHALRAFFTDRGAAKDQPGGPMVQQIKANLSNIPDHHHRQHHGDWLTVVRIETRYVCNCPGGFAVYVDAENVMKTRHVPQPPGGFRVNTSGCDKGR
jgi:hypothetical protein